MDVRIPGRLRHPFFPPTIPLLVGGVLLEVGGVGLWPTELTFVFPDGLMGFFVWKVF
jgi:hypothetical protein